MSTVAPRRTKSEQRDATRQRILNAGVECLIEFGQARTTTLAVQERAGVSRGALLHHFPSRAELLAATVDHLFAMQPDVDESPGSVERAVRSLWASFTSPLAQASQELWTAARTDPELRAALRVHEAERNAIIQRRCRILFGDLAEHPDFDTVLRLLVQAMRGAAAARAIQPEASARGDLARWTSVATKLLS